MNLRNGPCSREAWLQCPAGRAGKMGERPFLGHFAEPAHAIPAYAESITYLRGSLKCLCIHVLLDHNLIAFG